MQSTSDLPILHQLDSLLLTLGDANQRDDVKLKALQEISDHFEALAVTSTYPVLMDQLLKTFLKILEKETCPQFIGENNTQQLRKLMLEMIHRMPLNSEHWKQYVKSVLGTMFKLMEIENEENSLVCLRIIIEFHKQFRPGFSHDIQQFLAFVKRVFAELPKNFHVLFEPRAPLKVNEIQELNFEIALQTAFVITPIHTDQKTSDGSTFVQYTLLPKGVMSLKVLTELPISIILFHQVYKQSVQSDMLEFIPLIMNVLNWMPSQEQLDDPNLNREILIDFLAIQVKAASFFAVLCRTMPECMKNVAENLVKSITIILHVCPPEVSTIRKELMVAFRHLLATDLRTKFISYLDEFFNDKLLLGTSFTTQENLRHVCYSTVADLVHHSRNQLTLENQKASIHYFSRLVFDSTLPFSVHNMSIKLLLNLIEGISKQTDTVVVKEMILFMLDVFVRKFSEFAREILPALFEKCERKRSDSVAQSIESTAAVAAKPSVETPSTAAPTVTVSDAQTLFSDGETKESENNTDQKPFTLPTIATEKDEKLAFAMPMPFYLPSLSDSRTLVKMLVYGAKTIAWGLSGCRFSNQDPNFQAVMMSPRECEYFVKIVKYGFVALDVYTIIQGSSANTYQRAHPTSSVRSKEEKEVMDHFAGIFTMMNLQTFKEIFSTTIEYIVERIGENHALQLIPNTFLVGNVNTSAPFGSILIGYLIKRIHLMGSNPELSNLYLKLFKLVYGSVSVFPADNELMLRPYLHKLVNDCVELAISTKDPYNYLLLLRGLFRSIGGGSHDVLYQEFLPVLPGLLKSLNALQSGYHQQSIRELIVELCLTVPVRLSSLVPHIPMLMEPLVLALNGTPPLVLQGLRTLELCIDNLQPEFLHEHMGSVRSNLMHALWSIICNSDNEAASMTAWRTVGKLGGLNRKVLTDKQMLDSKPAGYSSAPKVQISFFNDIGTEFKLEINILKALQTACSTITRSSADLRHRILSLKLLNSYLLSISRSSSLTTLPDSATVIRKFENVDILESGPLYQCTDNVRWEAAVEALAGLLFAATNKETRQEALPMVNSVVRHLTFLAAWEQIARDVKENVASKQTVMNNVVLIDAIAKTLADEDKESCKAGILAMTLVIDTATGLLKSKEKVCQLSFIQLLCRKVTQLCYRSAWYAKLGGCAGIKFILENLPAILTMQNVSMFFSALIFVVQELSIEIANGAIDFAKNTIDIMLKVLASLEDSNDSVVFVNALQTVVSITVRHLYSSFGSVRDLAISVIESLSKISNRPIILLLESHIKNLMQWLNFDDLNVMHLSPQCQIGMLEAMAYICSKDPPIAIFDPSRDVEQKVFDVLLALLELEKFSNITLNISDKEAEILLIKLKQSVLKALLAFKRSQKHTEPLFTAGFKCLISDCKEIQEVAFETMSELSKCSQPPTEVLHSLMKPLLLQLNSINGLTLSVVNKLLLLTKLFPLSFTDKFSDQLFSHLNKWLEMAAQNPVVKPSLSFLSTEMEICATIVEMFQNLPLATPRFVDFLIPLLTKAEVALQISPGSPWRKSLLRYLIRYPSHTVDYFFNENSLKELHICNYMVWMMKQEEAKPCRTILQSNQLLLANLLLGNILFGVQQSQMFQTANHVTKDYLQALALRLIRILAKRDRIWLLNNAQLVSYVRNLWNNPQFRDKIDSFDTTKPKSLLYALKILLFSFDADHSQIDILFDILTCFSLKSVIDLSFVRKFLETEVAQNYSISWKRQAFFKFVDLYCNPAIDQRNKTLILQYVVIPCIARSFERGEVEQMIGGPPTPELDTDDNLVSVFLSKIIVNNTEQSKLSKMQDVLVICLYELTSLFVEYASAHIHDGSKKQGSRLRTVMTFAWPCLQQNVYLDPIAKYYGHLLIAHIINKFAINRKIVLQVFHSLLKAHGTETRYVVRQALNILTPAVPLRMEDGQVQLAQLIKKTFIEEGYSSQQIMHLLQLLTRHYKVFYPVRHQLMQYVVPAMQKVALQSNAIENRRLAVDVCEMIIKWEMCRLKRGDSELGDHVTSSDTTPSSIAMETAAADEAARPFDKTQIDTVVNFLIRLACSPQQEPISATGAGGSNPGGSASSSSPAETFCKRCLLLVKVVLKPDMWGGVVELKLQWIEKALLSVDQATQMGPVCVCLDVLTFIVGCLPANQIVQLIKPMQRGLVACLNSSNSQMVKSVFSFMSKLLSTSSSAAAAAGTVESSTVTQLTLDNFDLMNSCIQKTLTETLTVYEKAPNATISSLGGALMLLKALSNAQASFIDRISPIFVKTMLKMAREFASPVVSESIKAGSEMLVVCLDLIRTRIEHMNPDIRKQFVSGVLCVILEKSTNPKLITAVIKLVDEWMKCSSAQFVSPSFRERQTVLTRLLHCVEKRFSLDHEVTKLYLELAYTVFKNDQLRGSELLKQMHGALVMGLTCHDAGLREKYLAMFNETMPKRPFDRLFDIMCSFRWDYVAQHYWIKQCVELMLSIADQSQALRVVGSPHFIDLSSSSSTLGATSRQQYQSAFFARKSVSVTDSSISAEPMDWQSSSGQIDDNSSKTQTLNLWQKELQVLQSAAALRLTDFLPNFLQLSYYNTDLAESIFLDLLPSVWTCLTDSEKSKLTNEIVPFLSSKFNAKQADGGPSVLKTFVEAFSLCTPPIYIKPQLLRYLGRSHRLWHKSVLLLEQSVTPYLHISRSDSAAEDEKCEILETLADVYSWLNESDLWVSTLIKKCKFSDTPIILAYEQQGLYANAVEYLEKAMGRQQNELTSLNMNLSMFNEFRLWENLWAKCMQELNQWDIVRDFAAIKSVNDPFLLLESAWRIPNWTLMREAIYQIEHACPSHFLWKLQVYRGYWTLCSGEEQHVGPATVERIAEQANQNLIKEWRKLPKIVARSHVPLLQAAQQVVELSEAAHLCNTVIPANINRQSNITDMKSIVKTWRNRSPTASDALSHWSQIFSWRLFHYQNLITALESDQVQASQNAILGIHAYAQCLLQFAKAARKQGAVPITVDALNRLHTIPNLPAVDGFQKLREQVKCCIKASTTSTKASETTTFLNEALDVIENSNISYFSKETSGEFYGLKGVVLSHLDKVEDAAQAFSASLQMSETSYRPWAYWGDHLDNLFLKDKTTSRTTSFAANAIVCYLQAVRLCSHEAKTKKYISKILMLLKFDTVEPYPLHESLVKFINLLVPFVWIFWLPQLLLHLKETCRQPIVDLLIRVGKGFPEAMYYSVRFIDPTNTICLLNEDPSGGPIAGITVESHVTCRSSIIPRRRSKSLEAPVEAWQRCVRDVLFGVRDFHPFLLSTLSKMCNELSSLYPRHWSMISLRTIQQALTECYKCAFEKRNEIPSTVVLKLKSIHDVLVNAAKTDVDVSTLAKGFEIEFELNNANSVKRLQPFIPKLVRWSKAFDARTSLLPKLDLMPEISSYLASFASKAVVIDVPSEIFSGKQPIHFRLKISKFLPKVETIQRGNWLCKRIWIRGTNGKKFAFFVLSMNDLSCDPLKMMRLLQLLRVLNGVLAKNMQCASRLLQFSLSTLIPIGSNSILVSDELHATTLLDVLKEISSPKDVCPDDFIVRYFEKLTVQQSRGQVSHQNLRDVLKDIQTSMLPKNSLTRYFTSCYPNAESYFTIRKHFCLHMACINLVEYCFHLTSSGPAQLTFDKESGFVSPTFLRFDILERTGELDPTRPVHFRLTPCLVDFFGFSLNGHLAPAMIAAARCFHAQNLQHWLRLFVYDEFSEWSSSEQQSSGEDTFLKVMKSVASILSRLQNLANADSSESKVHTLLAAAQSLDNLCRMEPFWHPWL